MKYGKYYVKISNLKFKKQIIHIRYRQRMIIKRVGSLHLLVHRKKYSFVTCEVPNII